MWRPRLSACLSGHPSVMQQQLLNRLSDFHKIRCKRAFIKSCQASSNFMIFISDKHALLTDVHEFRPALYTFLDRYGRSWYESSARNAFQDLWLSRKSAQGKNKIIFICLLSNRVKFWNKELLGKFYLTHHGIHHLLSSLYWGQIKIELWLTMLTKIFVFVTNEL
jgi:hypothetical protein